MRLVPPQYPVDRYLVESSKSIEMVNIVDYDIWEQEPTLKPEDELILRKLHEMLQSTADDLKLLSGELSKFHEPGYQVKSTPTPLDEEFNEKIHIEEVVNAKFHGYKLVEKPPRVPVIEQKKDVVDDVNIKSDPPQKVRNINTIPPGKIASHPKKSPVNRNLGISRTRILEINEKHQGVPKQDVLNNGKVINNCPAVVYNEFSFKYPEPEAKPLPNLSLKVQEMPSINIRSELKEQKVLQLDILPDTNDNNDIITKKSNVTVVTLRHETISQPVNNHRKVQYPDKNLPVRKISKMSTFDSSESAHNISSDAQLALKTHRWAANVIRSSPRNITKSERNKKISVHKKEEKSHHLNPDVWKRKLNAVYGSANAKKNIHLKEKQTTPMNKCNIKKTSSKEPNLPTTSNSKQSKEQNNTDYIPYSQLTLGGVRVSDIEKELSDKTNKHDMPLSPILDKILSSRENSFSLVNPKKNKPKANTNFLTTSDENLLQEVIDIEKTVTETISKQNKGNTPVCENGSNESYADDFEDEKSDCTIKSEDEQSDDTNSSPDDTDDPLSGDVGDNTEHNKPSTSKQVHDTTYTKIPSLSFKNSVDVFEFVHSIDTQETATQSNTSLKLPNETQTSPVSDKPSLQPIHNDLWPSLDPKEEVEKLFKLEKDFIKQLIIEEYGDLIEKKNCKPSTSIDNGEVMVRNVAATQKNTQTSPAHVKSVMTSPTKTKTRMTSPFMNLKKVDHQTSPLIVVTDEEALKIEIQNQTEDSISINLSSPRFRLRLPQNSQEVLCNIEDKSRRGSRKEVKTKIKQRKNVSSSSSGDAGNSSSEISSLGEVRLGLWRRNKNIRVPSYSESSTTSTVSRYSSDLQSVGILPLRSEGELSLSQKNKFLNKTKKSDGEMSFEH